MSGVLQLAMCVRIYIVFSRKEEVVAKACEIVSKVMLVLQDWEPVAVDDLLLPDSHPAVQACMASSAGEGQL